MNWDSNQAKRPKERKPHEQLYFLQNHSAKVLATRYKLMLAGGLKVENVVEAIHTVQPWGVDVASGVEASKGIKRHK